jgi:hypothetical protein
MSEYIFDGCGQICRFLLVTELFLTSGEVVITGESGDAQRHMLSFIHRTNYNHHSKTAKDEYDSYPEPDWVIAVCVFICF